MDNYYTEYHIQPEKQCVPLKKKARAAVNLVALTALIASVISIVVVLLVSFLQLELHHFILNFAMENYGKSYVHAKALADTFFESDAYNWFLSSILPIFCSFIPFAVMSRVILKMPSYKTAPLKGKIMGTFPFIYCAALVMASVLSIISDGIFCAFFPDAYKISMVDPVSLYGGSADPASLFLCFLSTCVVAPVVEEYIYRGVMFGYLRKFGFSFAAFSASLIFGLDHATVSQIAYTFVFGLVLCVVTERTGNLKTALIMHFLNNFIVYVQAYLLPLTGSEETILLFGNIYNIFMGVFAVVGMVILFASRKKYKDTTDNDDDHDDCTENAPISSFFCVGTVFVTVSAVFNLLMGML